MRLEPETIRTLQLQMQEQIAGCFLPKGDKPAVARKVPVRKLRFKNQAIKAYYLAARKAERRGLIKNIWLTMDVDSCVCGVNYEQMRGENRVSMHTDRQGL